MNETVIVGASRTAIGKFGGSLKDISAVALGATVIAESLKRAGIDSAKVDEVIMGNVLGAGLGQNPARQASVKAGIPYAVPSMTINKVCGSGLKAINLGAQSVQSGEAEIIVAGGLENMSQAPFLLQDARWGYRLGNNQLLDSLIHEGLWDIFNDCHMAVITESLAEKYKISRPEQDNFALESQLKAKEAQEKGRFKEEMAPVRIVSKKGEQIIFDKDEFPRPDTTLEKLSGLKPAFKEGGTITAGNASGINDGAAAVVITSSAKAKELQLKTLARIVSYASSGIDPKFMGLGPVESTRKALKKVNLSPDKIDLFELNEAFAAQSLAVIRELGLNKQKVNVNGGAIALGHPIGASGTRILVTLLYELKRQKKRFGLATLCIGGGMGITTIVENIE
ncbi:MAG: acetyl-CoA C-acetyltransferase [Candidatus Omnitrophica bacterium]|nr:acetyl-CoA C-acetyltransferase [Candidatus Omnitrophota bacterium]